MKSKINKDKSKTIARNVSRYASRKKYKKKYTKLRGGSNPHPRESKKKIANAWQNLFPNVNNDNNDNNDNNEGTNLTTTPEPVSPHSSSSVINNSGTWEKVLRGKFKVLDKSPHRFSFTYRVKKDGTTNVYSHKEDAYTPIELKVDLLQYYVNNGLIKLTPDNKIQINSEALINDTREVSYSKGGTKYIDVFEDSNENIADKIEGYKMLTYKESLQNLFNIKEYFLTKTIDKNKKVTEFKLLQDLWWLRIILSDLNTINTDIKINSSSKCNLDLFLDRKEDNIRNSKNFEKNERIFTKCDLNVNHNKLIIEEINIDQERYIILGYPDMTMFPYLKIYEENEETEKQFETVYKNHKTENNKNGMSGILSHIADLNNFLYKEEDKQITTIDDIHLFFGKNTYNKYITEYYKLIVTQFTKEYKPQQNTDTLLSFLNKKFNDEYGIDYNDKFENDFLEKQKDYYNALAKQYLNKPMRYIKYNFIVFKEVNDYNIFDTTEFKKTFTHPIKYVPAIFNFRELKSKHKSILDKIKDCIYKTLPKMYGITTTDDEEYMLFYSTYKYGTFFHIKTEYLHTLSNIFQSSYKYQIMITLEELIYMVSLLKKEETLEKLKVEYKTRAKTIREDRDNAFLPNKTLKSSCEYDIKSDIKTDIKTNNKNIVSGLNNQFNTNLPNITILLLFKEIGTKYTCIYKYIDKINNETHENIFYFIQFKSNLCSLEEEIKKIQLLDNTTRDIFHCWFIKQYLINTNDINLFKIIKHCELNIEDYNEYMIFNPLFIYNCIRISNTQKNINLNDLIKSPLSIYNFNKIEKPLLIPNLFKKKPILLRNYLGTSTYKDAFDFFKKKYAKDNTHTMITTQNFKEHKANRYRVYKLNTYDNIEIYKIFFNPGNCKYTFILFNEYIKNDNDTNPDTKIIIWVVPINSTDSENIVEIDDPDFMFSSEDKPTFIGNCMELNDTHLKMLEQIQILYNKYNTNNDHKLCVTHIISGAPIYFCLHFHIYINKKYTDFLIKTDHGNKLIIQLNINKIINYLIWKNEYYNKFNINTIRHY